MSNPNPISNPERPQWRRDFPIPVGEAAYVSRRDFVRFLLLISGAFTAGQYWIVLQAAQRQPETFPPVELTKLDQLPVHGVLSFTYPTEKDPCFLVRLSDSEFVAFDRRCTHLLCPVVPEPEVGRIHCPCHEGEFELSTGDPISGPPQRPLKWIVLDIHDNAVFAVGLENRTT